MHVCERAAEAACVDRVVVATDADEIAAAVQGAGFEAVLTSSEHPNGTSRVAEAAKTLKLHYKSIIVNVQGDEPEIEPGVIEAAVMACGEAYPRLTDPEWASNMQWFGTVASPMGPGDGSESPNVVKVVTGTLEPETGVGLALYFSRAAIPHVRDAQESAAADGEGAGVGPRVLRHVGVYAYTREALDHYVWLKPTPLETAEKLEQLRWLEHGKPLAVAVTSAGNASHRGIDTDADYRAFVERYRAANGG